MSATPNAVAAYLERLEPEARRVVEALRSVVRRAVPDAEETIAWGSVSYHTPWVGFSTIGSIAGGRGATDDGAGSDCDMIFIITSGGVDPAKARRYVSSSNPMTPRAKMSSLGPASP